MSKTVVLLLCLIAPSVALAQYPGGGARGGMGAERGAPSRSMERGSAPASLAAGTTSAQLDLIEDDLKLTDAQRPLWLVYADRVQKLADQLARVQFDARTKAAEGTAAEQLDRLVADERYRSAAVEDIAAQGKALYASLSPEQRTIADKRLAAVLAPLATGAPNPSRGGPPARPSR